MRFNFLVFVECLVPLFLPLIQDLLWSRVEVSIRIQFMNQIEVFKTILNNDVKIINFG